ncbi:MAG: LPS assembly protein LptD [Planctomycetaceae bacterium]|nr:LPS assembly protein LptD [Planctomycetaceae bacterium]
MLPRPHRLRILATASIAAAVAANGGASAQGAGTTSGAAKPDAGTLGGAGTTQSARRVIDGSTLGGFVLPTKAIEGSCTMSATRGWRWKVDDTQRLFLEGDVRVSLGGYSFSAKRASVWINRLPLATGDATQIAVWFERAEEPTRRAGLGASGRDLLVTTSFLGETKLTLVAPENGAPRDAAFIAAGNARLARYLQQLAKGIDDGTVTLQAQPTRDVPAKPADPMPVPGGALAGAPTAAPDDLPSSIELAAPSVGAVPIFRPDGTVSFSADSVVIDERNDRVAVQGMVELEYLGSVNGEERRLQLSAERGVIFLAAGSLTGLREGSRTLQASSVEGIYLEGAVHASDGEYTLRGAQVYYDLVENRAAIVDAVLRTYDRRRTELPIYTRAAEMRQVAADQWVAERATVSTSEFFTPHLAIGVDRVTVTQQPDLPGEPGTGGMYIDADGAAIEVGGGRILPLPGYEGRVDRIPLRGLQTGYEQGRGVELGTDWDLLALVGSAPVAGLDAELSIDGYTERGPGVGTTFSLSEGLGSGVIDLYGLYDFGGTDRTSSGLDVEVDAGPRGVIDAEWQTALSNDWALQTQLAYLSDETFASAWREVDFDNRREYETSVFFNGVSDNTALSLLAKYDLNDFISNSYLLASRSYVVDKFPELSYRRYGDEPFEGLTWSQQWSANLMSLNPTAGSPNSLGVPVGAWGGAILPNEQVSDGFDDAGYRDNAVSRLDTRHELSLPLTDGVATVTPFVSGQATGYVMDEFDQYSRDAENLRFQAGGGVRGSLKFVRVDDTAQSRLLDVNRMRHIVEPYGTLWAGWDSLETGVLPVYDQDYEGTTGGAAVNIGVRNTFQTQRGGSGAWQSVDWVKLDLGAVLNDAGSDFTPEPLDPADPAAILRWSQSPIPSFYAFRPEFSQWGSHAYGMTTWQMSDSLTLGGTMKYLFEDTDFVTDDGSILPNLALGSLGIEMRHSPVVSTYVEYRYIAPTSSELLQAGVLYRAGKRYMIAVSPQYDIEAGELRAMAGSLTRTFPDFDLNASAGYDLIEDDTFIGLSLSIPAGSKSSNFGAYNPAMGGYR